MPRIDIGDGFNLNYVEEGQGPPFVFVTGPSRSTIDEKQRKLLATHFRVIQYDTRGCGESDDADWYSMRLGAQDLVLLLKALGIGPGEAIIYGCSNGGVQTAHFAVNNPEWPRALIIDGSATHLNLVAAKNWRSWAEGTLKTGKEVMDAGSLLKDPAKTSKDESSGQAADKPASPPASTPPPKAQPRYDLKGRVAVLWELSMLIDYPLTPHLKNITCPALFLHGDEDKIVGPGGSVTMHRNTPGSTLNIVPKVGHIVLREAPEIAKKEILTFLKEEASLELS